MNAEKSIGVARLVTDEATARRISMLLFETLEPAGMAVSAFETPSGWAVEVQYMRPIDRELVEKTVAAASEGRAPALEFAEIGARDWVAQSLEGLKPIRVGRFVVHGLHDRTRVAPNRHGIEIEAALAFGTGHHGTTQGCLLAIDRIARGARPRRVLDIGAGTGVLAIAAARALRRPVVAGEIDPQSVAVSKENARLNRVQGQVHIVRASGVSHPAIRAGAPYDLVLANILLGPLTRLARPVRGVLARRATVVLSGLLASQANSALAAWRTQGLILERRSVIDGWATLTLRHGGQKRTPRR